MQKLIIVEELHCAGKECSDEVLIMAYVDGELDESGRRYVEKLLSESAEAREVAEIMRLSSAFLRSAFLDVPEPLAIQPSMKQVRVSRTTNSSISPPDRVQRKA